MLGLIRCIAEHAAAVAEADAVRLLVRNISPEIVSIVLLGSDAFETNFLA